MKQTHHSNLKKRATAVLAAVACTASLAAVGIPQAAVSSDTVTAKESTLTGQSASDITSQMIIGWNLGNSLDCTGGTATTPEKYVTTWGNPAPTQKTFDAVKAAGFNTVRIPTTWYPHTSYDSASDTYVIDEDWMAYVKQVVDYAYDQDMFVILNVHHEDEYINISPFTDETLATAKKRLGDVWTQIAEEFKDYDQHLIFEGMNEPRQKGSTSGVTEWGDGSGDNGYTWDYVNQLNAVFVNTVRSNGSSANNERLLMIPGYCASSSTTAIEAIEIPDNAGNVALSVHAYSPYFFTMDTSSYANHTFPGQSGYGEDYDSSLKTMFSSFKSIMEEKGVPIIIGEFSASDFDNTESRVNWATSYLTYAKEAGIPCVLWDNNVSSNGTGEAHGYLHWKSNTWYPNSAPVIEAMMAVYGITGDVPVYEEKAFSWDDITIGSDWIELYRSDSGTAMDAWGNQVTTSTAWKQQLTEGSKIVMIAASGSDPELVLQGGWYRIAASGYGDSSFVYEYTYDDIKAALDAEGVSLSDMTNLFASATTEAATVYGVYLVPAGSEVTTTTTTTTTTAVTTTTTTTTEEPTTTTTDQTTITLPDTTTTEEPTTTTVTEESTTTTDATTTTSGSDQTTATTTTEEPVTTTTTAATTTTGSDQTTIGTTTTQVPTQLPATTTTTKATTTTTTTTTLPSVKLIGDVNEDGVVSLADAVRLNKYLALKIANLSDMAQVNADCNQNGSIELEDLTLLVKYLVRLVPSL